MPRSTKGENNKKTVVRIVALILLFLMLSPVAYAFIKGWIIGEGGYAFGSFQYTLKMSAELSSNGENNFTQAYFWDSKTGEEFSFLQYAHRNYSAKTWDNNYFTYHVDGIKYVFRFKDFENPTVTLQMNDTTYTLAEDGKNVIPKYGKWPFIRNDVVCPLPEGKGFYHPISITGMDGYAMVVTEPEPQDSVSDVVSVFIKDADGWQQSEFVFPDGTRDSCFIGYMRRHFCLENSKEVDDGYLGDLELCQTEEDGTATLYRVNYSENGLVLEQIKTYESGLPVDWKF